MTGFIAVWRAVMAVAVTVGWWERRLQVRLNEGDADVSGFGSLAVLLVDEFSFGGCRGLTVIFQT